MIFDSDEGTSESLINSLAFVDRLSGKSLMQIKNSNEPRIEPWGTPVSTSVLEEVFLLKTALYFLSLKKSDKVSSKFLEISFWFNL